MSTAKLAQAVGKKQDEDGREYALSVATKDVWNTCSAEACCGTGCVRMGDSGTKGTTLA